MMYSKFFQKTLWLLAFLGVVLFNRYGFCGQILSTSKDSGTSPDISETFSPTAQISIEQNLLRQNLKPDGEKNFFIVTLTRVKDNKTPLNFSEIEFLKQLLTCLLNNKKFESSTDPSIDFLQKALSFDFSEKDTRSSFFSYLETSKIFHDNYIEKTEKQKEQNNYYCNLLMEITKNLPDVFLKEISTSCGIVVGNEYFFGQRVFPYSDAEQYTTDFSKINPRFVFGCNFLTQQKISVTENFEEIKKYVDFFYEKLLKKTDVDDSLKKPNKVHSSGEMGMEDVVKMYTLGTKGTLTYTQKEDGNNIEMFISDKDLKMSVHIPKPTILGTYKLKTGNNVTIEMLDDRNIELTSEIKDVYRLENKTFYALNGNIISTYNKSTYYNESNEFLSYENTFYRFGDKEDHSSLQDTIHFTNYVSTEICRDVVCKIRKDDAGRIPFHIIQANSIRRLPSDEEIPPANIFVFCDPVVCNPESLSHVYKDSIIGIENTCDPCYIASFTLNGKEFNISIYKIIDNQ